MLSSWDTADSLSISGDGSPRMLGQIPFKASKGKAVMSAAHFLFGDVAKGRTLEALPIQNRFRPHPYPKQIRFASEWL